MFQAPAKQTATDTIHTLSSRLVNGTLLEDRRAAILGLRSFAKEYPASVASGALRGLISSLTKDAEDVETLKIVLETLLMLFNPNEGSPEASEDIALWLADEFSQRQDNITVLLDLLETPDFYSRLYSLQLLSAVSSARPERTQECILSAPLGTTRLVASLDDPRDAVRNAGLLLLTDLTTQSTELQKLVAFENAFERIFSMIQSEGGLSEGGIVVQDCLALMANLIRFNPSNQSLFRETGCVPKLAHILPGGQPRRQGDESNQDFPSPQRDKNLWGLLAILRMFLARGSIGTQQNQNAFVKHGILQLAVNLAFNRTTPVPIKAEALSTCADVIRGNARIQEGFAQIQVAAPIEQQADGPLANGASKVYVIDALLDLTLSVPSLAMFEARLAACECIKAYFYNHVQIRLHFLSRAIHGHLSGEDDTANVVSTLIRDSQVVDPYRVWFAAVLVFHLVYDDPVAKHELMKVAEGDAESGEEVVTCIQAITGNLIAAIHKTEDERILVGYVSLLSGWLYEDGDAVNDFLNEGSSLQVLMQFASKPNNEQAIARGLCAVLLGTIYEFSSKDSPISRRKLQPILNSGLTRERYIEALTQLRSHPLVRDFEVLPQGSSATQPGVLPDVLFDATFVEFLKDNFSRLSRAIDKDPGIEVNLSHEGIDRDLVDSLRETIEDKSQALQKAENELLTIDRKLSQEQADHRKDQETSAAEVDRIKNINDALQRNHDLDHHQLETRHSATVENLRAQHESQVQDLQKQVQNMRILFDRDINKAKENSERELARLQNMNSEKERQLVAAEENKTGMGKELSQLQQTLSQTKEDLIVSRRKVESLESAVQSQTRQIEEARGAVEASLKAGAARKAENSRLQDEAQKLQAELEKSRQKVKAAEKTVAEKEEARSTAQTELDDLLIVLGDLEEKRSKDKARLKELGEEVSDAEDDDGNDDDGEDEEEEEVVHES